MLSFETVCLGELGTVVTGKTPRTHVAEYWDSDYKFIGPTDLHKHFFINQSEKMISAKGLESLGTNTIDGLSILVGCIGWDMGNVGLVKGKCATNQQINAITKIKNDYNPLYVYYWLKTKKEFLFKNASVTRTPILNKSRFSELRMNIPSTRTEQDRIVDLLSTLDAKIELNNRINAELEAMAKLLYDYWFVQFDFPMTAEQATALGQPKLKGQPYKTSGGKMVFNPTLKRDIPEGWEDDTLDKLGEVIGGSTPSKANDDYFCTQGTPWITPKDLSENKGKKFIQRGGYDVSEEGKKAASLKVMPAGTVLLSSRAPIGYTAIASTPLTTNQGFKSFVPNRGFGTDYVYRTLNHFMKLIEQNASGSTFKEISGGTLKAIKIPFPNKELEKKYAQKVSPISSQQQNLEKQNQELTKLRDWLLPMLMNGQVTVI